MDIRVSDVVYLREKTGDFPKGFAFVVDYIHKGAAHAVCYDVGDFMGHSNSHSVSFPVDALERLASMNSLLRLKDDSSICELVGVGFNGKESQLIIWKPHTGRIGVTKDMVECFIDQKLTRHRVYEILDGERKYQDAQGEKYGWGNNGGGALDHSLGDFLLMMEEYITRARTAYCQADRGAEDAKHHLRKATALGVACMEKHGALKR